MISLIGYGSSDEEESLDEGRQIQLKSQVWVSQLSILNYWPITDWIDLRPYKSPNHQYQELKDHRVSVLRFRSLLALTLADNKGKDSATAPAGDEEPEAFLPNGAIHGPSPQTVTAKNSALSAPSSPYTIQRVTVRSLTLPTKPNLDIPRSPRGSPTRAADPKFSHFLELKKQGIHFNTKLASSSALKNPSVLLKLMDFAGVNSQWQYTTTLSTELWDPAGFPTWAYKEELAEAQKDVLKKKKEEERVGLQRERIDFVAASTPGQASTLVVPKGTRASAAERVMTGLGEDRKPSPQLRTAGVRNEAERRGRTSDGLQVGARSKSPRRRKGSRSR